MESKMSPLDVLNEIRMLESNGFSLKSKKVKQAHPDLVNISLEYFPSWEHAIEYSKLI
jgi:hypothetical protein